MDAATQGDNVAETLVAEAATRLAESAAAVVGQLWASSRSVLVSYGGSLLLGDTPLTRAFITAVERRLPGAIVQSPRHPPAVGAGLRALAILRGQ